MPTFDILYFCYLLIVGKTKKFYCDAMRVAFFFTLVHSFPLFVHLFTCRHFFDAIVFNLIRATFLYKLKEFK